MKNQNENIDAFNLKVLVEQAKNVSASAIEKIVNMGIENKEVLKAMLEVAEYDIENTIMSLTYLAEKGNKNAINAIYALSHSYSEISTRSLLILSESNPECKKMLEMIIDKYSEIIFKNNNYTTIPKIKTLGNIAKVTHNEDVINKLIEKLFSRSSYDERICLIQILGDIAYESRKAIDALIKSFEFDNGITEKAVDKLFYLLEDKKVFKAITKLANENKFNSKHAMNSLVNYIFSWITTESEKKDTAINAFIAICKMVINTHSAYSEEALNELAKSSINNYLLDILLLNKISENGEILRYFGYENEKVSNQYIKNLIRGYVDEFDFSNEIDCLIANNTVAVETLLKVLQKRAYNGDDVSIDLFRIVNAKNEDEQEENLDNNLKLAEVLSEIVKEENKSPIIIKIAINELYNLYRFQSDHWKYDSDQALDVLLSINIFDNTEIKDTLIDNLKDLLEHEEEHSEAANKISSRIKELDDEKKLIYAK